MNRFISCMAVLALLAGCSRNNETAPSPSAPAPAPAAAAQTGPAPSAHVQVPVELLARLQRPDSPVLGPAKAPVTLVEFLDPSCEACRAFAPVVKQIQFLYPEDVKVVLRFADFHPGSDEAIRILLAAQRQGKLETVMAALFDAQESWASHHQPNVDAAWKAAAATDLNMARARKDAASAESTERLRQEAEDIIALQVSRTPTFYVNGKLLVDFGVQQLMDLVSAEVARSRSAP